MHRFNGVFFADFVRLHGRPYTNHTFDDFDKIVARTKLNKSQNTSINFQLLRRGNFIGIYILSFPKVLIQNKLMQTMDAGYDKNDHKKANSS